MRRIRIGFYQILIAALLLAAIVLQANGVKAQQIGFQWSKPIDITQPSGPEADSFVVMLCDRHQNAYILWGEQSTTGAAIYYRNDIEDNWSLPRDVIATADPVVFGLQAAISNHDDTMHVIWLNRYAGGDLLYSRSGLATSDKPRSWSPSTTLAQEVDWATIQVDSQGTIHVVYGTTDAGGLAQSVIHIKSSDGGNAWSDPIVAYSTISPVPSIVRPEMTIDGRDRLHVGISINSNEYGTYSEVGYVRSTDGGATWNSYKQIETMGTTFQGVAWIAPYAFGTDEIHLTWHDPRRMHAWSFDGGNTWHGPEEIMPLGAAFGGRNQLVKDSAGILHVVTAVGDGVYSASWNGVQWSAPEQIDDRFIDPHGQTMIVCQGNQLHVAYYDRTGDNKVWYSTRKVDVPHIEREPIPAPQPTASVASSASDNPTSIQPDDGLALPPKFTNMIPDAASPMVSNPLLPALIPTIAVLILIVAVFIFRRWKRA